MNRLTMLSAFAATAALTACTSQDVDNVQERAEEVAGQLENRADEIAADADNAVGSAEQTLENQAKALEDDLDGNQADEQPAGENEAKGG